MTTRPRLTTLCLMLTAVAAATLGPVASAEPARAPEQPATGPGSTDYAHKSITPSRYEEGDAEYWIFEPADPAPASAPVVVFLHGWAAMSPNIYGGWIDHLVRRGCIVVFPRYQADIRTPPDRFTANAADAVRNAINTLRLPGHVKPDLTRTAFIGHSVGGLLAANLAAIAGDKHLPKPRAVLSNQPGIAVSPTQRWGVPLEDLANIPADTLLVTTTGDRDAIVGDRDARRIIQLATAVPADRKALIAFTTDLHGWPWLVADHNAPASLFRVTGELDEPRSLERLTPAARRMGQAVFARIGEATVNAMDHRGYWALFDRLTAAAWSGQHADDALARTNPGRSLGQWTDGKPIAPLRLVKVDPAPTPRLTTPHPAPPPTAAPAPQ